VVDRLGLRKLSAARKHAIGRKRGKLGGKARADSLTKEERQEIAKKLATAHAGKKAATKTPKAK